jgi:hypothetical protein
MIDVIITLKVPRISSLLSNKDIGTMLSIITPSISDNLGYALSGFHENRLETMKFTPVQPYNKHISSLLFLNRFFAKIL